MNNYWYRPDICLARIKKAFQVSEFQIKYGKNIYDTTSGVQKRCSRWSKLQKPGNHVFGRV